MTLDELRESWHRVEAQLVGAALILYDGPSQDLVLAQVPASSFDRGEHRKVWEAISTLRTADRMADTASVTDELQRVGRLDPADPVWLTDLTASVPSTAQIDHHAKQVIEADRRRRLFRAGQHLAGQAHDPQIDCDDLVGRAVDALTAESGRSGDGILRVSDVSDAVLESRERGVVYRGVKSGWSDLDPLWRVVPGNTTVLAGLPSHGKSAFLDALLVGLAETHGWRTCLFSPESAPTADHVDNLVTTRVGRVASLQQVSQSLGWLHDHFTWVDHESHSNVSQILTAVRAEHARRPIDSFVIDPWTEVDVAKNRGEREDEYIRREMTKVRQFARKHSLHAFVVVHPKSMDPANNGVFPIPRSHNLHGGSVWKKQADALVVVWRDEAGVARSDSLADIVVQKIRRQPSDGKLGRATLRFDMATNTYQQVTKLEAV